MTVHNRGFYKIGSLYDRVTLIGPTFPFVSCATSFLPIAPVPFVSCHLRSLVFSPPNFSVDEELALFLLVFPRDTVVSLTGLRDFFVGGHLLPLDRLYGKRKV